MDKKIRLPKEGFIDGTETEGTGGLTGDEDVEGHGMVPGDGTGDEFTIIPSPPSIGMPHGGE